MKIALLSGDALTSSTDTIYSYSYEYTYEYQTVFANVNVTRLMSSSGQYVKLDTIPLSISRLSKSVQGC
jgi:hypothetical protein